MLGFMDFDSSVFDGTSFQFVRNPNMLLIDFTDPQSGFRVVTPGPDSDGTWFDSTGPLPIVVGGGGYTGGVDPTGVWIAGTSFVMVGGNPYTQVSWVTTAAPGSVPEPSSTLVLLGLGLAGLAAWRRRG
jgi:hypothetical protein